MADGINTRKVWDLAADLALLASRITTLADRGELDRAALEEHAARCCTLSTHLLAHAVVTP